MSVNWEEIIRAGIKKLELEDLLIPENESEKSANYYYRQGTALYKQDRYAEAIAQYTQAIEANGDDYLAYLYRGACHLQLRRSKQGIKDYDRAIVLKSSFTDGYYYRGYARKGLGDLIGAIADFSEVIKLDPDKIDAYFERGTCNCYLGEYSRTVADFTKLIDFNPSAEKYYNRGVTYYLLAEYEKAIADLTKVIELEPEFIAAYFNLGNAYYQIKDCQQATHNYRQGKEINAELDPQDQHGYFARGIAAINQEHIAEGIADLREAAMVSCEANDFALNLRISSIMQNI